MIEKTNNIKISFVVIAYNDERYISECLDSIIEQEIEKEIICIDDCSSDNTYKILEEYANNNDEMVVYQNETNRGCVFSRCEGIKLCSGEYLLFVDSDDRLIGSFIDFYRLAKAYDADILEFSIDTDGYAFARRKQDKVVCDYLLDLYQRKEISNTLINKLVSSRVYRKIIPKLNQELIQANFSEAVYFLYHLLIHSERYVSTESVGYFYYSKRGATATSNNLQRLKEYCAFQITKNELERVYGFIVELHSTWNYACNQAVCAYLELSEREQKEYKYLLLDLMSEEKANYLIQEHTKLRKAK